MNKSLLEKINNRLNAQGGFLKSVSILVSGTAFAQLITVLTMPFLTRIYSPDDFGVLATYASILSIISTIACLRLETAIPIPKSNFEALNLATLGLISTVIFSLLVTLFIIFFQDSIILRVGTNFLLSLWFIPVGVLFSGLYMVLRLWASRSNNYKIIAKSRITQSIMGSTTQISLGLNEIAPTGLIVGHLFQNGFGFIPLLKSFLSEVSSEIKSIKVQTLKYTLNRYRRFPQFSTFESLANVSASQLPILMIALYESASAGLLMLAIRLLAIPMSLIGGAVGQVYLANGAKEHLVGNLKNFTYSTLKSLVKISIVPFILIALLAPYLTPIVFGSEWLRSGSIIVIMLPWFFMQFITSPISMSLHITESQITALFLQFFGLIVRVGSVGLAVFVFKRYSVEAYAISGFVFYSVYLIVILKNIKK